MAPRRRPCDDEPTGTPAALQAYLAGIGRYPLLSPAEEQRLGRLVQDGRAATAALDAGALPDRVRSLRRRVTAGQEARERFVQCNLRLVVLIARHYRSDTLNLLDLVQEGNLGLIRAVERFDPERGFRFSTYARYWVHQAVNKAVAEHRQPVRVPVQVMDRARQVQRAQASLDATRGRSHSAAEVAEEVGLGAARVADLMGYLHPARSLSEVARHDRPDELGEILVDAGAPSLHDDLVALVLPGAVRLLLDGLNERERQIVRMHFGLEGTPRRTLAEIGTAFSLTRERIRQIEARALEKLRNPTSHEARRALALVAG